MSFNLQSQLRNLAASDPDIAATRNAFTQAGLFNARNQQGTASASRQQDSSDWRVKLSLAPGANYLYQDPNLAPDSPLRPLLTSNGILFPYTPSIDTSYHATYDQVDLPHSNWRGYFYKNSYSGPLSIKCIFTAQDTFEANYVLAVIHFFRSVTKMFYGQDSQRGCPPPLVFLTGLGQYQFNNHPLLVQDFTYSLPPDVDYIRAGIPAQVGLNLAQRRALQGPSTSSLFSGAQRLMNVFLPKGATPAGARNAGSFNLGGNSPTYVPTKIDISVTLLPVQSRQQMSQQFSLQKFASGELLKGGFW